MATWFELDTKLGKRDRRKVGNNTYAIRRNGEAIAIRLHATDVITFYPNGEIQLNTNGWETVTTKQRMNAHLPLPFGISQKDWKWWLIVGNDRKVPFYDGIRFNVHSPVFDLRP